MTAATAFSPTLAAQSAKFCPKGVPCSSLRPLSGAGHARVPASVGQGVEGVGKHHLWDAGLRGRAAWVPSKTGHLERVDRSELQRAGTVTARPQRAKDPPPASSRQMHSSASRARIFLRSYHCSRCDRRYCCMWARGQWCQLARTEAAQAFQRL